LTRFRHQATQLHHDAVEHSHEFIGAIGHRDQFAPGAYFGHPKAVLSQDMCPHVVGGANHKQGKDAWIGVDRLQGNRIVGHDSVSLH